MDPNQSRFNPEQNPFEAIFAGDNGTPQAPAAPVVPVTGAPEAAAVPTPPGGPNGTVSPEEMGPEELQPGKTGDNTKPLLMAVQALHNYIAASTDPGTIQLVRNLISALTQLVARDQKASEQLAMQQQQQGGQVPQAPAQGPVTQ